MMATIGAFVRAADGTLITATSTSLDVNLTNASVAISATDLDIRDLAYATDSVTAYQGGTWDIGTLSTITNVVHIDDNSGSITVDGTVAATQSGTWNIGTVGSITGTVTVSATDLDIRDLTAASDSVAAWVSDGSGNAISSTGGALDINIKSGDIDDSLANTDVKTEAVSVGTTATPITASALSNRKWVLIANEGSHKGYWGKTGVVTAANGFPIHAGERQELRCGAAVALSFIGGTGASSEDYRTAQLS